MSMQKLKEKAKEGGAKKVKVISASSIVIGQWVRVKCQYGCEMFGKVLTCPPFSPTPEVMKKIVDEYKKAILIYHPEYETVREIAMKIEEEAFFSGYYKAFALGAGPCNLCGRCEVAKPCRHLYEARPSMEACGIDVYKTVRNNGWKIEVIKAGEKSKYFGLILIK